MRHHDAETDLDDLLRSAAPPPLLRPQQETVFTQAWDTITASVTSTPGSAPASTSADPELARGARRARRLDVVTTHQLRARRHRRLARASAITLTVALAGVATAAAATYLATHTGERLSGWQATAGGPGEVLRQDGSDYVQTAEQLSADIPFAPGHQVQREAQFSTGLLGGGHRR